MFTIKTRKKAYKKYNNTQCYVVNAHREDGLIEVFVIKFQELILLRPDELDET